jgi:hypothetical protein
MSFFIPHGPNVDLVIAATISAAVILARIAVLPWRSDVPLFRRGESAVILSPEREKAYQDHEYTEIGAT